ncbi:MAG: hypothetical protein IK083_01530 [Abditibacteriota bacterium]|nr:hypothetical protein [Abditibacteriota bacterium]
MLKYILSVVTVLMLCTAAMSADYKIEAPDDLKKYVPEVEKALGDALNEILANEKQAMNILKPYARVSKDICDFLGCPEKDAEIRHWVNTYYNDSVVIAKTLSKVVLISEADARKEKNLQKGYVNYMFSDKTERAEIIMSAQPYYQEELLKNVCLPVIIKSDGTVFQKEQLVSALAGACGVGEAAPALTVRAMVSDIMKNVTKTSPWFCRWYTEGMAYKVTSELLSQYSPAQKKLFDQIFSLKDESRELRDKVNLWDFADISVMLADKSYNGKLDAANIQYACELTDALYEKVGKKGFGSLNAELKYDTRITNEKICATAKTLFDMDLKARLLEYSPQNVKDVVSKGSVSDEKKQGEDAIIAHEWQKAVDSYAVCLLFDPGDYNARLNQATAYRELGDLTAADVCIAITANTMDEGKATIHLVDIENNDNAVVVLGKYFFLQEAYPQAYGVLLSVYEDHKDWEDVASLVEMLGKAFDKKEAKEGE